MSHKTEHPMDAVLAALRDVEPATGMEQRIAAALRQQADEAAASSPWWRWPGLPECAALAAVVTIAVLLALRAYPGHTAGIAPHAIASTARTRLHRPDPDAVTAEPGAAAAIAPEAASTLPSPKRRHLAAPVPNHAAPATEAALPQQDFPAPPLPLTEQERLLIRLVHRDDPVQLAQLAPAAREAELQRDRDQVREFFKAPPMPAANFKLEPYPTLGGTQ